MRLKSVFMSDFYRMVLFLVSAVLLSLYIFTRLTCGTAKSRRCLVGKTALITGANRGIGFQIALDLAARGCRVIMADKEDCEESKRKIIDETSNSNVVVKYLDLASLASVRKLANDIIGSEGKLDILINNAGIGGAPNQYTEDGLHPVMQVNSFAPFLLTHLLLNLLKQSAPSRIVFTTACIAFVHKLSFEILNFPENYPHNLLVANTIYANSKMCNILIADGFARRLQGAGVTVNSVHPGLVNTAIFDSVFVTLKSHPIVVYCVRAVMLLFGKSPREGAQTTIYASVANEVENVSGEHFWDCIKFPKPPLAKNVEFADKLWEKLEVLCLLPHEKLK